MTDPASRPTPEEIARLAELAEEINFYVQSRERMHLSSPLYLVETVTLLRRLSARPLTQGDMCSACKSSGLQYAPDERGRVWPVWTCSACDGAGLSARPEGPPAPTLASQMQQSFDVQNAIKAGTWGTGSFPAAAVVSDAAPSLPRDLAARLSDDALANIVCGIEDVWTEQPLIVPLRRAILALVQPAFDDLSRRLAEVEQERDDWQAHAAGEEETAGNARILQKQAEVDLAALREQEKRDVAILRTVRDEYAEQNTRADVEACEQCGPMVMCSFHSLLSLLFGEAGVDFSRIDQAEVDLARLREAVEKLTNKIDAILASPAYHGVFMIATVHGCPYDGPSLEVELADTKALLASRPAARTET